MFSEVEKLYSEHPEIISRTIERECVRRLISLLPEMVKRVEMLSVLGISQKPPKHLVSYMTEAGRCFIYGQFLACLFLCRSVIETCTEDRLRERGFSEEVQALKDGQARQPSEPCTAAWFDGQGASCASS